jgi:hypothetical protein
MLEPVLTNLSEKLHKDNFKLCYDNVRDVYNSRHFDIARSSSSLGYEINSRALLGLMFTNVW